MKYIFVFKQSFEKNKKVRKFSIIATYLVIALATIIFLLVAVPKIIFPYEAHWMEGSMLDAISRIQSGIPLFERPSIHYVPWLYQPLYYYITAALTTVSGLSFPVARIPSVLSTLVICSLLYSVVKKESEKQFFAIAAAGLFIASYAKTEYCLVMARVDPLFTVFLIGAVITIFYFRSPFGLITGALLLALSFFTKQTGMVFAPGIILYLWYIRGWKSMMIFLFSFGFFVIVGILIFNAISDGWYYYYTFLVPKGKEKTLRWEYAINGFFIYIFLRCWLITIIFSVLPLKYLMTETKAHLDRASIFFGVFFINAVIAGFLGILNDGGGHNVLLPLAAACGLFLPLITSELVNSQNTSIFSWLLIPIQLLFLVSNPWSDPRNIVDESDRIRLSNFFNYAASLPGNVWVPYRGYIQKFIGKEPNTELNAMHDVFLVDDSTSHELHRELDTALEHHHWSYIFGELKEEFPHYTMIGTMRNPNKMFIKDDTAFYIYQPKK